MIKKKDVLQHMLSKCNNCITFKNNQNRIRVFRKNTLDIIINNNKSSTIYLLVDEPFFASFQNQEIVQKFKSIFYGFNLKFISLSNCITLNNHRSVKDINHCYFNDCTDININRQKMYNIIKGGIVFCFGSSVAKLFGLTNSIYYHIYTINDTKFQVVPKWSLFKLNLDQNLNNMINSLKRLSSVNTPGYNFKIVKVKNINDCNELILTDTVVLDIESNSLNIYASDFTITRVAIQNYYNNNTIYLFNPQYLDLLKDINLLNKKIIGYNTKFDILGILKYFRLPLESIQNISYEDVLLQAYMVNENRFLISAGKSLKDTAVTELNVQSYDNPIPEYISIYKQLKRIEEDINKYDTISLNTRQKNRLNKLLQSRENLLKNLASLEGRLDLYNCLDVYYTGLLYNKFKDKFDKKLYNLLINFDKFLNRISINGFKVDMNRFNNMYKYAEDKLTEINQKLKRYKDIEWTSVKQISEYFETLPLVKKRYVSYNQISTSDEDLESLSINNPSYSELFTLLRDFRFWQKQKTSYLDSYKDKIDENSFIHGNFNLTGTVTGRLSSTEPNFQNIANKGVIKKFLSSRYENGYILECDYSQMEMRVMAMYSGDERLKEIFDNDQDIYIKTASFILNKPDTEVTKDERNMIKKLVLSIQYGVSTWGISTQLGCSLDYAENLLNKYFEMYPKIKEFNQACYQQVLKDGYISYSFNNGRKRRFPEIKQIGVKLSAGQYRRIYRESINAPIQGTASDLCLYNAYIFDKKYLRNKKTKIINVIHDSIIFDVAPDEKDYITNNLKSLEYTPKIAGFKYIIPLKIECKWHYKYWDDEDLSNNIL